VIGAPDLDATGRFYTDMLGLKVSDYMDFERAGRSYSMAFFHAADGRHHSLALVAGPTRINHLMIETDNIDAVGHALDRVRRAAIPLRSTLGRHSNDLMVSFYAYSPNGVAVEVGCDGIRIDDATWKVARLETPSLWGHEYVGR
jgi:3,4-dihydroxy-9,10-secoandrosta-1,3,5(10)-triene-9,17-dione 4,5-dioxygenase